MSSNIDKLTAEIRSKQSLRNAAMAQNKLAMFRSDGTVTFHEDGGSGSGNWGHVGVPGSRGGSAPGGGAQHRLATKGGHYTSFSKLKKTLATPHKANVEELKALPEGSKLAFNGKHPFTGAPVTFRYEKIGPEQFQEVGGYPQSAQSLLDGMSNLKGGSLCQIAIPNNTAASIAEKEKAKATIEQQKESISPDLRQKMSETRHLYSKDDAMDRYIGDTKKAWENFDSETKYALFSYTKITYDEINTALRTGKGLDDDNKGRIDKITSAIDKVELKSDSWLVRGTSTNSLNKMFGTKEIITEKSVSSLIGQTGQDKGFISCGSSEGTGFTESQVQLSIFAPAGTKAIYAEPFSQFGFGGKEKWDGSRPEHIGSENETILQRGTQFICTNAKYQNGKYNIEVAVVGQEHD